MNSKHFKDEEPIHYPVQVDEKCALADKIQNSRALLTETEEFKHAIFGEGGMERKRAAEKLLDAYELIQAQSEELYKAHEALLEAKRLAELHAAKLNAIIAAMPVEITIYDQRGEIIFISEETKNIFNSYQSFQSQALADRMAQTATTIDGKLLALEEMPVHRALRYEETIKDFVVMQRPGTELPIYTSISCAPIRTENREIMGAVAAHQDITEHIRAEEALKKAYDDLEEKVKERTIELQKKINSLKENEKDLAEVQKMANIGNWHWNLLTNEVYWSDEVYRIFKRSPKESAPNYEEYMSYVHPDDRGFVADACSKAMEGKPFGVDHRIILDGGEERTIYKQIEVVFDEENNPIRVNGVIQDITERKKAEETLEKLKKLRIKEIHHRIKNNLQVISSLLDLQADKFEDRTVRQAFSESQNRIYSMSLIHEELYRGNETDKLDFSVYLKKLAENLFDTYSTSYKNINLRMDLEENAFIDMDIAVPLGIIVNELVSNSLKYAFTEQKEGEIRVQLCRHEEISTEMHKSNFRLTISDSGKGIPEDLELESIESLGLKLVSILVDQLDGKLEMKSENGAEFIISFTIRDK